MRYILAALIALGLPVIPSFNFAINNIPGATSASASGVKSGGVITYTNSAGNGRLS